MNTYYKFLHTLKQLAMILLSIGVFWNVIIISVSLLVGNITPVILINITKKNLLELLLLIILPIIIILIKIPEGQNTQIGLIPPRIEKIIVKLAKVVGVMVLIYFAILLYISFLMLGG